MHHDIALISTMAISLVYALVGGYIANRLRLPPLVGYLIAGIIVGPFTPGFVADRKLAPQLAEIGVILLMFGVGLHFSIRDLLAVRKIAIPGALVQIALSVALTCGLTHFWGWPFGPSLVLGLALSVASANGAATNAATSTPKHTIKRLVIFTVSSVFPFPFPFQIGRAHV